MKRMRRWIALIAAAVVATSGCGSEDPRDVPEDVRLRHVLERPEAFDGRLVRLEAAVVRTDDVTLLTPGLAESYPPQAVEPTIYVGASLPDGGCITRAEGVAWGEVRAEGRFRHEEEGAFGPLGVLPMALRDARLSCP